MIRSVTSELVLEVGRPALVALAVAAAPLPGLDVRDELRVTVDGRDVDLSELQVEAGGRTHLTEVPAGRLVVHYEAEVRGHADPVPVSDVDRVTYLRPCRYAESDRLERRSPGPSSPASTAPRDLLAAVSSWVGTRLSYVPGSSGPTDGAVDTLLQRQGVCRDYAHLVVALLRGAGRAGPAGRGLRAGPAPDGLPRGGRGCGRRQWRVVDATLLAPARRAWCASRPAATPPTPRSCPATAGRPTCSRPGSVPSSTATCPTRRASRTS